jgi:alcohol dehydrogenase
MAFTITSKSEVLFGEGVSQQIGEKFAGFGCKRVFCVYDKGVKAAGLVDGIVAEIEKKDISVVHFDDVLPDPPDTLVNECGEFARKEGVDGVLGIGGGSSMDTAKAVNLLLGNPGVISQYFGQGTPHTPGKPLILVPTSAGTASEITALSIISDTKNKIKTGIAGPATSATLAVVDPLLTRGLPPHITAAAGMDAFAHALEAYTSVINNLMSDALAEKALELIITYLPRAVKDGTDMEARTQMSFACLIAGMSFNDAIPHFGHAFGHALGCCYHIPHGVGCALGQPGVVEIAADVMPEKIRKLGGFFGLVLDETLFPAELGRQVSDAVLAFSREIGIPTLKELDIKDLDFEEIAQSLMTDICYSFLPKPMDKTAILDKIKEIYAVGA